MADQNGSPASVNAQTMGPTDLWATAVNGTLTSAGFQSATTINTNSGWSLFGGNAQAGFGADVATSEAITVLHEARHSVDFFNNGVADTSDTFIMGNDAGPGMASVSAANSQWVNNTCFGAQEAGGTQGGNSQGGNGP